MWIFERVIVCINRNCFILYFSFPGWDQTDKLMKIYVQLAGIENIPKENIKLDVKSKSFNLLVCNLNKMNHNLSMPNLLEEVDPSSSFFRVSCIWNYLFCAQDIY